MTIWQAACWIMGHEWTYRATYRVCAECGKLERLS